MSEENCYNCKYSEEQICHLKLDDIVKLKESTRKLLCLLEEIKSKINPKKRSNIQGVTTNFYNIIQPIQASPGSVTDGACAIKRLESQTKTMDAIYIEEEDNDCSVYKRLTRKCHCLNQQKYNDFVIHFNENTKYFTSTIGEIIKNMRILKKFLYMGCGYTKNALKFLNEGLSDAPHSEKVEIIQGCAHADICNVFDNHSIVIIFISWPCKYENCEDTITQALTAELLWKLVQLEEGRRYLNFNSKITNDIKKVIKKRRSKLEYETLESINATLAVLNPPLTQNLNVNYYCKTVDEGAETRTVNTLIHYRQYMTLDEVFTHMNLLHNISKLKSSKTDLTLHLFSLLNLFKNMLIEYDNSQMNIIITNILNNIISRNIIMEQKDEAKTVVVADTATEPVKMKNETNQVPMPQKKINRKKNNKSKQTLGMTSNKSHQHSKQKDKIFITNQDHVSKWKSHNELNRSRGFTTELSEVIIVPVE